jgi:hypothetical protein
MKLRVDDIVENPEISRLYLIQRRFNGPLHARFEPAVIVEALNSTNGTGRLVVRFEFDGSVETVLFGLGTVRQITAEWLAEQVAVLNLQAAQIDRRRAIIARLNVPVNTER